MKVVWSDWALDRVEEIYTYLVEEAGERVADRMVFRILEAVLLLKEFPRGGQLEPWLEHKDLGYRRVVVSHYKVVYRIVENEIRITDVFDTRQSPKGMKG